MSDEVYVTDSSGELAAINTTTLAVHRIGDTGVVLTDIGFAPSHALYGISYTELYKIDPKTGHATAVGSLGVGGMNALTFDAAGRAYAYSGTSDQLYTINLKTGVATAVGKPSGHESAGDLAFYKGKLLLSDTQDQLLTLNPANGAVTNTVADHIDNLYGLIATDAKHLYGFAGTTMYALNPATGASKVVEQLAGHGLAQIYGAAFDGYFQSVAPHHG
jgi:hypothetical protein